MQFQVIMKNPDALEEALYVLRQTETDLALEQSGENELDEPTEEAIEDVVAICRNFAEKYFKYGEYLTVEFDTDAKTAKVIPV